MDGVPDHAAVTESVELAKAAGSRGHGLVNAVLRRAAREGAAVLDALGDGDAGGGGAAALAPGVDRRAVVEELGARRGASR